MPNLSQVVQSCLARVRREETSLTLPAAGAAAEPDPQAQPRTVRSTVHDINNMLSVVVLYTEMLEGALAADGHHALAAQAGSIRTAGMRAAALASNLGASCRCAGG